MQPNVKASNSKLYQAVVVGMFLTMMGVVMGLTNPGIADTDLDIVGNQIHFPVVLATAVFYIFILLRIYSIGNRLLASRPTWLAFTPLVLFCCVSSTWSSDPAVTLRRAAFLMLSTLIGIILGIDFSIPQLVRLLAAASLLHMLLCGAFFLVSPSLLYSPSDLHALKGLTTHKNIFGFEEGVALIAFLLVPFRHLAAWRFPLAISAGILVVLSHSSGSLVATLCAVLALPLLFLFSRSGTHRIPLALVSSVGMTGLTVLLTQNAAEIPALLSKDPTLTGRTELWSLIMVAIGHHPLLGYGYDSFWQGLQGESLEIIRGVGWLVPTAHNGYLDLLLSTGICGAVLILPPLLLTAAHSARYLTTEPTTARFFRLLFSSFGSSTILMRAHWLRAVAFRSCSSSQSQHLSATG